MDIEIEFRFCFSLVYVLSSMASAFGEMEIDFIVDNSIYEIIVLVHYDNLE
jgi:hypothetical protein